MVELPRSPKGFPKGFLLTARNLREKLQIRSDSRRLAAACIRQTAVLTL
jgi:hypothetical protein